MILSEILYKENIDFKVYNEKDIKQLGLSGYTSSEDTCTFIENNKYLDGLSKTIKMIITNDEVANYIISNNIDLGMIVVDKPRLTFFRLHNILCENKEYKRDTFKTQIGENCNISKLASISENNVMIGNNVVIEEFVTIRDNTVIGDNVKIRSGSVIGGEGFEFKKSYDNVFLVNHIGGVVIRDNVEIQYNSCIDKAIYPWDNTVIGEFVKIDNLVHIAHGVKIDDKAMIVANVGIGGRVTIGKEAWIGFGATIRNGITIGDNSRVNMGAVVTKDVKEKEAVSGNFAIEHNKFIENLKNKEK